MEDVDLIGEVGGEAPRLTISGSCSQEQPLETMT